MKRLVLGTVQFGQPYGIANYSGQVSRQSAREMLQLASDSGIDMLDTAHGYGESESCLGEVGINAFKIVTKLPAVPQGFKDIECWVRQQFESSLERLAVRNVYGLLLHRPAQLLEPGGAKLYHALLTLKAAGLVEKVGISVYSPEELDSLIPIYDVDLVQAPLNLIDQRLKTSGWLDRLKQNNIEVHTRSVFLQGLLLMHKSAIPSKFLLWGDIWSKWHRWLENQSIPAARACLAFPLSFPEVDRVVVGADGMTHLSQIIDAANGNLSVVPPDLVCTDENLINPARWPC